jgi:iron complex outermembrane receptor protein
VDLSRIPRAWIERIEIVRGAEGAIYGPGAAAGAVNVITRPAAAGSWSAEATGGSFRTFAGSADGAIGGRRWGLLGAAAVEGTSGRFPYVFDREQNTDRPIETLTREHNGALTAGGLAKLWAAVGAGRLDAVLQLSGGRRDLPGTAFLLTPLDWQRDVRASLATRLAQPLADGLQLLLDAEGLDDRLDVTLASVPPISEARQRDAALRASAALVWAAGPSVLTARVGGSVERLDADGAAAHSRRGLSLTIADDLLLSDGRVRLGPALRWDAEGPYRGVSAKLGATARVAGPVSVRASGGRGFRVPSFPELYLRQGLLDPNPDLVPETSWSADAAVVADGRLGLASAGAFLQLYDDLIVYETSSFRRMKPFNDGKAVARGLEVELASAPLGWAGVAVSGAYTFLATETLRGDASVLGKSLPHRARHRLFARLAAGHDPIDVHVEAHALSEQFQDLQNSGGLRVPAALTFNVGGGVRLWRRPDLRLHLDIRNVLDDRTLQDGFGNPLPGRMVMLTLRAAWGKDTTSP